ncbi:MAG: autotransporter domain-containing protein [Desulfobaccales bacterium]
MAAEIKTKSPAFVLCGGDQIHGIVTEDGSLTPLPDQYTQWKAAMTTPILNILNISYPVRGNHETYGEVNTLGPDYAKNWMDNIANVLTQIPKNGPPNEVGMTYSFSKNNVFIIGLDQDNVTAPQQVNQAWLNAQLQANNLPFTFVYGHYPAFNIVTNENSLADHPAARDAFWKSLGDNSVNIYFTGHIHLYNRAQVAINGGPEIQQIVVGTGGAPLDTWNGIYPDSRVILESHKEGGYGYTLVTVNGNTITAVYYSFDGVSTWTPFDIYTYTLTSRNFGANDANQSIDPAILDTYYQGTGWGIGLTKIGLGTLTLNSGTSTYSNTITVSAGGLNVQGDYANAPVIVQSGGSLSGTGTIGNVTNSGTVSPGNSPGTLNVVGSYTQTSNGTLRTEVASPTNYDIISISGVPGTANLTGTIAPTLLGGYRPLVNQVFPGVVTTTGGVVGTFSNVAQPLTLNWQPVYNVNRVDLQFQPNYANPALGLTSDGQAVGNMLQGVAGGNLTGGMAGVLNAIDSLNSTGAVANAYKQISPEKAGALASLGFVAATFQVRNLATRTTNLRFTGGQASGGSASNSGGLSFNFSKLDGMMLAYNGASLSNLFSARKEFQAPESRWGLFADGGAAFGSQNSSVNQTGYNFTLGGLTVGADYRLLDNLLVGLATGYSNTSSGFFGSGGSVNANTIPFNAYAAYFPGSLYAYGSLGYALNLFDLKRGINFDTFARTASSSTTGNQFNLYGETGYDFRMSRFILTPAATLAYSALWVGGFTEQGAGDLNLKIASQTADSLQTGLGGRLTVPLRVGSIKVVPQGYAFYQHEFSNGSRGLNASLSQGSSTFNFQTDAAKRNYALVGASIIVGLKKNISAQINYNAEVGRSNSTVQYVNAGLRLEF